MRGFAFSNGDFVYNPSGFFEKVTGTQKIRRDIYKRLVTDKQFDSNQTTYERYNPDYGTSLNNKKVFAQLSRADILNTINSMVNAALQDQVANQKNQVNLPADEVIDYVDFITVYDSKKQDLAKCSITVKLVTGQVIDLGTFVQKVG